MRRGTRRARHDGGAVAFAFDPTDDELVPTVGGWDRIG